MTSRNLTTNFFDFRNRAVQNRSFQTDEEDNSDRTALLRKDDDDEVIQFDRHSFSSWMEFQRQIQLDFDRIKSRMKKLQQLQDRHLVRPAFDENSGEEKEVEATTKEITTILKQCRTSVQRLSVEAERLTSNAYEQRVSINAVQAAATTLQDLVIKFRKCQSSYLQKIKCREEKTHLSMPHMEINLNSNPFGDQDDPTTGFDQMSLNHLPPMSNSSMQLTLEAQPSVKSMNEQFVEHRDREIKQVLQSIEEMNQTFADVCNLISIQGNRLDQIECNIEHAVIEIEKGNVQLEKAVKYKHRFLKLKLVLYGVIVFALLFIILIVVIST